MSITLFMRIPGEREKNTRWKPQATTETFAHVGQLHSRCNIYSAAPTAVALHLVYRYTLIYCLLLNPKHVLRRATRSAGEEGPPISGTIPNVRIRLIQIVIYNVGVVQCAIWKWSNATDGLVACCLRFSHELNISHATRLRRSLFTQADRHLYARYSSIPYGALYSSITYRVPSTRYICISIRYTWHNTGGYEVIVLL